MVRINDTIFMIVNGQIQAFPRWPKVRQTIRRWSLAALLQATREYFQEVRQFSKEHGVYRPYVTLEEACAELRASKAEMSKVFMALNRAGELSQKVRHFAHDTNRNPMFDGSDSGWAANIYYLRAPSELSQRLATK